MSVIVVSLLLLEVLFSLLYICGGLPGIEIESFVFGIERTVLQGAAAVGASLAVLEVAPESATMVEGWKVLTGLLAPLCMCLPQYFSLGTTSLLHLHFFPSVLLHLPASSSVPFLLSKLKLLQPTTRIPFVMEETDENVVYVPKFVVLETF